jgi:catechol 2,3-dioxygenase-like lactoylglutathione lyase family enzyme
MALDHKAVAILPCKDLGASQAFYERLGFVVAADHGDYRILDDGRGWHLHLRMAEPGSVDAERNASGLYFYAEDVDRVADRVRELIIEAGTPAVKPWGMYEFAVSDPDGVLVRIGRAAS